MSLSASPAPRRYTRASVGAALAGVCEGLARHLGVEVRWVRLLFVGLALAGGPGVVIYAGLWVFAPLDEREADARRTLGATLWLLALTGAALVAATWTLGLTPGRAWPLAVTGAGVVLLWRQADEAQRARWRARSALRGWGWARALVGALLLIAGLAAFFGSGDLGSLAPVLLAIGILMAGLAVLSSPWWVRMARDLAGERAARIREQERAEIAAHLHDSVLHTLALIQRSVDDPREVSRLSRAQERQLRTWLYRPVGNPDTMLAPALQQAAAEVEDEFGVTIEVVTVGDAAVEEALRAVLLAAREALVNAAKYAGANPIALYAEVSETAVEVFVRDSGPGFDPATVPEDRLGIRHSIVNRVERAGGRATVTSAPGERTEVSIEMPRRRG